MKKKKEISEEKNVDDILKKKEKAYVLFYASWCPHSQRFLPIFEEYAKTNPDECLSIMIDFRADLCDKYAIDYYPTVLLLKKGNVKKRLDATPGIGLSKAELADLTANP